MARQAIKDLYERLIRFIEEERLAAWRQINTLYSMSTQGRVSEGECISGLTLDRIWGDTVILSAKENYSKFRKGDALYLGDGKDIYSGFKCQLEQYDHLERIVYVKLLGISDEEKRELKKRKKGYVLDKRMIDLYSKRISAVGRVFTSEEFEAARRTITLETEMETRSKNEKKALCISRKSGFNKAQEEAFLLGFTKTPAIIQGPPGTGKTWLLANLAVSLAKERKRVLICCFTHRAVNNALNQVKKLDFRSVYKICNDYHIDDLSPGINWGVSFRYLELPRTSCIVGATPYGAFNMASHEPFDAVIFDESGQLTIDMAMMGMCCSSRYIFVGDHMQMAPVLIANHKDKAVSESAFKHLFDAYPSVMLDTTYRMNEGINEFSSVFFYRGRLKPSESTRDRVLVLSGESGYGDIMDPSKPSVFIEINHRGVHMRSPLEAQLIAELVIELIKVHNFKESEIAVITPFRAQIREIKSRLEKLSKKERMKLTEELVVDTVERIQGQEREIILVSFAASDEEFLKNRIEFFYNPNRLNVAITRARVKRILIGSKHTFLINSEDRKEKKMLGVFKQLYSQTPKVDYTDKIHLL